MNRPFLKRLRVLEERLTPVPESRVHCFIRAEWEDGEACKAAMLASGEALPGEDFFEIVLVPGEAD